VTLAEMSNVLDLLLLAVTAFSHVMYVNGPQLTNQLCEINFYI